MKTTLWMPLGCLLSLTSISAFANKPPVEVDIVVGDDDDFFEAEGKESAVEKKADRRQEELDAEAQAGVAGDGKNINTNTQVVKVVIVGDKDSNNPTSTQTAAVAPPSVPATPSASTVPVAPAAPAPPATPPDVSHKSAPKDWWDVPSYPDEGQFLVSVVGGGHAAGGFLGMVGEGMATEQLGLRIGGVATGFEGGMVGMGKFSGNFDVSKGGIWANQRSITKGNLDRGVAWLVDTSMVFHIFERSMFDPYVTAGLALYGYELAFNDRTDRGGAGYTRLGAGGNLHWSRFFAGADFGWYPIELFRFELVERRPNDFTPLGQHVDDRFVAERFVASVHAGMRF